jgi:GNAT superfamily N-acetyltransferase
MIELLPFQPENQNQAKALILAGLAEHWGYLDENKNPDLNDISASYTKGTFLVAWADSEIVGTGAFVPRSSETIEIVRMSVAKQSRRQGIGQQILGKLCCQAYQEGYRQAILETTSTWQSTIAFYEAFGFQITHFTEGDVYFELDLRAYVEKQLSAEACGG